MAGCSMSTKQESAGIQPRQSVTQTLIQKPYGLWDSPISAHNLAGQLRLSDVQWDSDGQTLVWLEGRAGRNVLVCATVDTYDAPRDLTVDLSVRAQICYGGGDFCVSGGYVFFVASSGRLYRQGLRGGMAHAITPEFGHAAAPAVSPDGRWVLYVHTYEGSDCIAVVDVAGTQWPQQLVSGHDFYMQPRWNSHGHSIAYIAWDHPRMPWDGTTLYLARLRDASPIVSKTEVLAGGDNVAILQPEFSPDGRWLAYVSDQSGWGHVYLYDLEQGTHHQLTSGAVEHGTPAWVQGLRTYGWSHDSRSVFFIRNERGFARLYRQPVDQDTPEPVVGLEAYTWLEQPSVSPTTDAVALIGSSSTHPSRLVLTGDPASRILRRTDTENTEPAALSEAQPVSWTSADGSDVHGLLYMPHSQKFIGEGLPPAIIKIHGGPTSQARATYDGQAQYFATRGYTVLVVNYRGSTGYGRAYMESLRGNWGISDIEDAASAARYLVVEGLADKDSIVIMGGSAGGYTVLESLCRVPGIFRAGLCFYGVSNMFALAADTHKFEAHYLDSLLGPLPSARAIYRERSPFFHAELLNDPLAIFQGEDDKVVPRTQSDCIVESLRRRGVPHEYHIYAGEGHGWRKPETIETFYQAIDAFLRQYVLFA